jgi:hypothetical protein
MTTMASTSNASVTRDQMNIAVVLVNRLLDLEEPRRSAVIARTMRDGDSVVIAVLGFYLALLPDNLNMIDAPTTVTEHVRRFIVESCEITHTCGGVPARLLYRSYVAWCESIGLSPLSECLFGRTAGKLTSKRAVNTGIRYTMLRLNENAVD